MPRVLLYNATLLEEWTVGLPQGASMTVGSGGSWDSFCALLQGKASQELGVLHRIAILVGRRRQRHSFHTLPHGGCGTGCGSLLMQCHTSQEQWAVGLLGHGATPPGSTWYWVCFNELPPCLG